MENGKAQAPLSDIQKFVADPSSRPFTATALDGGLEMGLSESEMRAVVCKLTMRDLYKSMTTNRDHTVWQDVYHAVTWAGMAYVKVTGYMGDRPPVIQFKRLEDES